MGPARPRSRRRALPGGRPRARRDPVNAVSAGPSTTSRRAASKDFAGMLERCRPHAAAPQRDRRRGRRRHLFLLSDLSRAITGEIASSTPERARGHLIGRRRARRPAGPGCESVPGSRRRAASPEACRGSPGSSTPLLGGPALHRPVSVVHRPIRARRAARRPRAGVAAHSSTGIFLNCSYLTHSTATRASSHDLDHHQGDQPHAERR